MPTERIEFPDEAGYPDGQGFLDEGTAADASDGPIAAELDEPSTDRDGDITTVSTEVGFRALLDGDDVAVMHAHREPGVVTITSTVVEPEVREQGIATAFIAHVLDDLRAEGAHIVVECPEIEKFLVAHPEYADLRA